MTERYFGAGSPRPRDARYRLSAGGGDVRAARTPGSGHIFNPNIDGLGTRCLLSCAIESLQTTAGGIIVLRVSGEVDLCALPILHAALDGSLDQYPAYLVVDLARMTFCFVRGLDLLIQAGRIAAERETGYAVTGVLPQIHRAWTLCWGNDRPIYYRSTAAAVTKSGLSGAEGAPGPWPDYHPVLEIVVVGCRVGMASHAWSRPDLVRARPARRCSASLVLDATGGWPLRGVTANLADFLLVSPVRDLSVVVSAVDRWGIDVSAVGWRPCSSVLAVSSGSRAGLVSGRGGAAWPSSWIRAVGSVLG